MAEGFLGRWSQRKQAVRQGKPVQDGIDQVAPASVAPAMAKARLARPDAPQQMPVADERKTDPSTPTTESEQPVPLSMQDVAALNAESDFKPFIARAVAPEVRNAAMKKLFADPHFNVMDGLDIYIDDYSIPDPLPASMLRKMASAQFLKLFDDEEKPARVASGPGIGAHASPDVMQADTADTAQPSAPDAPDAPGAGTPDTQSTEPDSVNAATTDPDKTDPTV